MTANFTAEERAAIREIVSATVDRRLSSDGDEAERIDYSTLRSWGLSRREALILVGSLAGGASVGYAVADEGDGAPNAPSSAGAGVVQDSTAVSVEGEVVNGNIVAVAADRDLSSATVDPDDTDTPIQDALDMCGEAGGGSVFLPPTTIESPGNILAHSNVSVVGFSGATEIAIIDPSAHGFVYDVDRSEYSDGDYIVYANLDGIALTGRGMDATDQGHAIHDSGRWRCQVGDLWIDGWNGTAWYCDAPTFACTHDYVLISGVDAGDDEAVMHWTENGSPNHFDVLEFFPRSSVSGRRSTVLKLDGGFLHVNVLKSGQDGTGTLVETDWINGLIANCVNWEPTGSAPAPDSVFTFTGGGAYVRHLNCWNVTVDYVYQWNNPRQGYIALPERNGDFSWSENVVNATGAESVDADLPIVFTGSSSQIDEEEDGAARSIAPLADLTPAARDR